MSPFHIMIDLVSADSPLLVSRKATIRMRAVVDVGGNKMRIDIQRQAFWQLLVADIWYWLSNQGSLLSYEIHDS